MGIESSHEFVARWNKLVPAGPVLPQGQTGNKGNDPVVSSIPLSLPTPKRKPVTASEVLCNLMYK